MNESKLTEENCNHCGGKSVIIDEILNLEVNCEYCLRGKVPKIVNRLIPPNLDTVTPST